MTRRFRVALHHLGDTDISIQTCETPEEALAEHIASESPSDGDHEVAIVTSGPRGSFTALSGTVTLRGGVVQAMTPRHMAAA